jgi:hypothetical protein
MRGLLRRPDLNKAMYTDECEVTPIREQRARQNDVGVTLKICTQEEPGCFLGTLTTFRGFLFDIE